MIERHHRHILRIEGKRRDERGMAVTNDSRRFPSLSLAVVTMTVMLMALVSAASAGSSARATGLSPAQETAVERANRAAASSHAARTASLTSEPIDSLFIFGDSLWDVGNNNDAPAWFNKANFHPYGQDFIPASGRFSNGKIIPDFLGTGA